MVTYACLHAQVTSECASEKSKVSKKSAESQSAIKSRQKVSNLIADFLLTVYRMADYLLNAYYLLNFSWPLSERRAGFLIANICSYARKESFRQREPVTLACEFDACRLFFPIPNFQPKSGLTGPSTSSLPGTWYHACWYQLSTFLVATMMCPSASPRTAGVVEGQA